MKESTYSLLNLLAGICLGISITAAVYALVHVILLTQEEFPQEEPSCRPLIVDATVYDMNGNVIDQYTKEYEGVYYYKCKEDDKGVISYIDSKQFWEGFWEEVNQYNTFTFDILFSCKSY